MNKVIWKQPLTFDFEQTFEWPAGSHVLCGALQERGFEEVPTLWFLCDPEQPRRPRKFAMLPTGGMVDEALSEKIKAENHRATFELPNGLVAHCFEIDTDVHVAIQGKEER